MSEGTNKGRLIVFEGPDGVGKSKLSLALAKRLKAMGLICQHLSFRGTRWELLAASSMTFTTTRFNTV